mgnify:FL=1
MYDIRSHWKKLMAVLFLIVVCIAFESVLGDKKEASDIELKNLYINESLGFHNNRAIVGINLNNEGKLHKNYYLVVRAGKGIDITSNLKDCTKDYTTFDYRVDYELWKKEQRLDNYRIFCLDGLKHPVIGLHTGQGNNKVIRFIIYQPEDQRLTPHSKKVFEKGFELRN